LMPLLVGIFEAAVYAFQRTATGGFVGSRLHGIHADIVSPR
jgi:hypothetical protein